MISGIWGDGCLQFNNWLCFMLDIKCRSGTSKWHALTSYKTFIIWLGSSLPFEFVQTGHKTSH